MDIDLMTRLVNKAISEKCDEVRFVPFDFEEPLSGDPIKIQDLPICEHDYSLVMATCKSCESQYTTHVACRKCGGLGRRFHQGCCLERKKQ